MTTTRTTRITRTVAGAATAGHRRSRAARRGHRAVGSAERPDPISRTLDATAHVHRRRRHPGPGQARREVDRGRQPPQRLADRHRGDHDPARRGVPVAHHPGPVLASVARATRTARSSTSTPMTASSAPTRSAKRSSIRAATTSTWPTTPARPRRPWSSPPSSACRRTGLDPAGRRGRGRCAR
jgi:hypothetical protein